MSLSKSASNRSVDFNHLFMAHSPIGPSLDTYTKWSAIITEETAVIGYNSHLTSDICIFIRTAHHRTSNCLSMPWASI